MAALVEQFWSYRMFINPNFNILETTLRDGNYVVDFGFTSADTSNLAYFLEKAGLNMIEIGHGLGLGASRIYKSAASSDKEYISDTKKKVTKAKIGMFAIPKIATLDDIRMAADLGLNFIRLGANIEDIQLLDDFINLSRKLNLFTCTNFMKSNSVSSSEFPSYAKMAEDFGSQMIYIVDSAGNMLPKELEQYIFQLKKNIKIPYGFHGHDNIGMANANSIVAFENEALLVDTTILGIGRGSGNASTEAIISIVQNKYNLLENINVNLILHMAKNNVENLLALQKSKTFSEAFGLANVHSMHMKKILEFAKKNDLDVFDLVKEIGTLDTVNCNEAIMQKALNNLSKDSNSLISELNNLKFYK